MRHFQTVLRRCWPSFCNGRCEDDEIKQEKLRSFIWTDQILLGPIARLPPMPSLHRSIFSKSLAILVFAGLLGGCDQHRRSDSQLESELQSVRPRLAPLVDALIFFKSQHGKYPAKLDDLEVEVPDIAKDLPAGSLSMGPIEYEVARDGSFSRISYWVADKGDYEFTATSVFDSRTGTWTKTSHINAFVHEEAWHFGGSYQAIGSSTDLNLAVASLVDSARNKWHPCRNLWRDWVEKALGFGLPAAPAALHVAGNDTAVEYRATDAGVAYAFVFKDEVHAPMKNALAAVSALYRWDDTGHWSLMQVCDSSAR